MQCSVGLRPDVWIASWAPGQASRTWKPLWSLRGCPGVACLCLAARPWVRTKHREGRERPEETCALCPLPPGILAQPGLSLWASVALPALASLANDLWTQETGLALPGSPGNLAHATPVLLCRALDAPGVVQWPGLRARGARHDAGVQRLACCQGVAVVGPTALLGGGPGCKPMGEGLVDGWAVQSGGIGLHREADAGTRFLSLGGRLLHRSCDCGSDICFWDRGLHGATW